MKNLCLLLLAAVLGLSLTACREKTTPTTAATTEMETTLPTTAPVKITEETMEILEETTLPPETASETSVPTETAAVLQPEPADEDFVAVKDYIPDVLVDLKYATQDNFTGQVIYEFEDVYLRYGMVKKLAAVQDALRGMGLGLKIWDGFRPVAAQFKLWEVCPDPTYVANPEKGYSNHNRGSAVDVTLVDSEGNELEMPTGFDDFSALADRDYSDCNETATANAMLLQETMEAHGMSGYFGEWWHFNNDNRYTPEEDFQPVHRAWYYADCNEYINLRTRPDAASESLMQIPAGEEFQMLAKCGDFALVDHNGLRGYVHRGYIQPVQ